MPRSPFVRPEVAAHARGDCYGGGYADRLLNMRQATGKRRFAGHMPAARAVKQPRTCVMVTTGMAEEQIGRTKAFHASQE